jgi:hypothetical protein
VASDRKIGQVANRIVQLNDVLQTYHEGIAFLLAILRAVKLPRAILIVNPTASAKDTLLAIAATFGGSLKTPSSLFMCSSPECFARWVVDDSGTDVERPKLAPDSVRRNEAAARSQR